MSGEIKFMKNWKVIYPKYKVLLKIDKNWASLISITINILNLQHHTLIYVSLWHWKYRNISNRLDILYHSQKQLQPMYGGTIHNAQKYMWIKITIVNKVLVIYEAKCKKIIFHPFWLALMILVLFLDFQIKK